MKANVIILTIFGILVVLTTPTAFAFADISSESLVNHNILTITINSSAPVTISDETPNYEPILDTVTVGQTEYEGILIVNTETEGNGIADADGNVNVQFTMNNDRPFCIAINHFNGENSKLKIDVTIDGNTKHYTSNISGYVTHYLGREGKYFSLATLRDNEDWIQTTSPIGVEITNYAGHVPDTVTLEVLFLD